MKRNPIPILPANPAMTAAITQCMLERLQDTMAHTLTARALAGLLPAQSQGDSSKEYTRLHDMFHAKLLTGVPAEEMMQSVLRFRQLMSTYDAARLTLCAQIQRLSDRYGDTAGHTPVQAVRSRLKSPGSIVEKLCRKGHEVSLPAMTRYIHDIAGVRIVCPYLDDVYALQKQLYAQPGLTVLWQKDYIQTPKPTGYRSLHLGVEQTIVLPQGVRRVEVELQLRTAAMDAWADLEHKMGYKPLGQISPQLRDELKRCADAIADADARLQHIAAQSVLPDSQLLTLA